MGAEGAPVMKGKPAAPGTTRLLVEKAPASAEETDAAELRASKLAELIERLGGKGRAKVYRVINGENCYCCTWPADDELRDNLEERLAELGGGKWSVKFYWGAKCEGSIQFLVDEQTHPTKKSDAEQRREGGAMPQTPVELAAFISQSLQSALQPVLQQLATPRDNQSAELMRLMLLSEQQRAAEARALSEKLLTTLIAQRNAPVADGKGALREVAETVQLVDAIRGGRGDDVRDAVDERGDKRSLAVKLIEGPVEKAVTRMADRVIDNFLEPNPATPTASPKSATGAAAPVQAAAPVATRPAQLPTPTPTTPVAMPRGVKALPQSELAKLRGGVRPAATPAPRAADAVPAAVGKK